MSTDAYPDALLRTVQRRLKTRRGEMARALVFAASDDPRPIMTSDPLRDLEASRVRGHQEPSDPDACRIEHAQEHSAQATA